MKVLLSPAKSIDITSIPTVEGVTVSSFLRESEQLVNKLKKFSVKKLEATMHISRELAELNKERYSTWEITLERTETIVPAAFAFNGEVYKGLDIQSFSNEELIKAQSMIRILSGMYGILKPLDLMYPYRLEMGTKWEISDKAANLYQFWGEKLTKSLLKETDKTETIVNLASTEYSKAIQWKKVKQAVVTPVFKEFKNGEYKVVMMYAKHQRGKMTRWILENNPQDAEALKLYQEDGYQFSEPLSSTNEWVFVR